MFGIDGVELHDAVHMGTEARGCTAPVRSEAKVLIPVETVFRIAAVTITPSANVGIVTAVPPARYQGCTLTG